MLSQAVITYLSAHRWRASQALGWAAGGRQVQGKINAICKVPFHTISVLDCLQQ